MGTPEFQFINFQNADDFKSRSKRRTVRSHIVKRTFERKKGIFRNFSAQHLTVESLKTLPAPSPLDPVTAISCEMLDPFESLPVDQANLQLLLRHPSAQEAVEPVFSLSDPYSFHNIQAAYSNAFADPAFSNALMCAISLATNNYVFAPEVLYYQGLAIEHVNRQIQVLSSLECTIGAILLLVGVEWRTKCGENAQIHLRGVEQLMRTCVSERRTLSASVRRGIFWQDVNTAVVNARDRVLNRSDFPEFQWGRSEFKVDWARLPSGFADLRGQLGEETADPLRDVYTLLQDIYVLQKRSESLACGKPDVGLIYDMDNMQACIEGRLIERLRESEDNPLGTVVLLTAYLYTYALFTQVWNGSMIPLHISSRLLQKLQKLTCEILREPQRSAILWCIVVAGCLIPEGPTRTAYGLLLQKSFAELVIQPSIHDSWFSLSGTLDRFLWSQPNFGNRALVFLKENFVPIIPSPETTITLR